MLQLAAKMASDFNYCRVDFLMSENRLIFSEMTFTPNAGRIPIKPKEGLQIRCIVAISQIGVMQ